ncbi:MAG: hypothetical protein IKN02_02820 [Prevotella sp.]|nr:hypothetical protein [Prevotella sp.]
MELTITKTDFETVVNVATSAHVEVYEKVEPHFADSYDECKASVLGDAGTEAVEAGQNAGLTRAVKQWVALQAFLSVFRQLDLVLTPTGFGVVSTQQMAPASKQRVDALIGHLRDSVLRAHGQLLAELCKVSGWGTTTQAKENVSTLFFDFRMLQKMQGPAASHLEWQAAQRLIYEADEALRLKLSSQYMDHLLDAVRCGTVTADDYPVIFQCRHIISLWIAGDQEAVRLKMRRLLNMLDADPEKYTIYKEFGYPVNHHETFQNTQDAPAYIFG